VVERSLEGEVLDAHLAEHGCGCPRGPHCPDAEGHAEGHLFPGFFHCPVAKALWDALPEGERILLG
jgi:hypothetical protein